MKKPSDRYWVAVCVGENTENKRIVASCLAFRALNRFYALQAIKGMLPENPQWVKPDGTTYPYELFALEQCQESESQDRILHYSHLLREFMTETFGPVDG